MSARDHNESQQFLWKEQGEQTTGPVVTVAAVGSIDKPFTFAVPKEIENLWPGQRVLVPVGRRGRLTPAFCLSVDRGHWTGTIKPVHSVIDDVSYLTAELLDLGQWISKYYACPLGRTLDALVPRSVQRQSGHRVVRSISLAFPQETLDSVLTTSGRVGARQRAVLDALVSAGGPLDWEALGEATGATLSTLRSMEMRGWIQVVVGQQARPAPDFDVSASEPAFQLNDYQLRATERLRQVVDDRAFRAVLLFGVSGSGKTEVYIRAMRHVLETGQQVIMLVPEIALTTQLVHRLTSRFQQVAVIHSGLSGVQRSLTWSAIRSGEKKVVIGTRSAIFAPCERLGLIVVDEEQEPSYKNLQAPRYHVRDVAIKRAQQLGIPIILGSATPSLETWHNCQRLKHYEIIELPSRVGGRLLPEVTIVDMNDEARDGAAAPHLSRHLIRALGEILERGEQAIILMNRRGFARWLMCARCGHRVVCPSCDGNMVYHASRREVICHRCSRRATAPSDCPNPSCDGKLAPSGSGTQRIEAGLNRLFPAARLARADSDTMLRESLYRRLISDFEARRIDVLIGTQMIAKGLDFPGVSLVGIIGADTTLAAQDFRSGERLFQMITQVAGRAGRGEIPGRVIVQSTTDDLPALRWAVSGEFGPFAEHELAMRRELSLPPYWRLARMVLSDAVETRARTSCQELANHIRSTIDGDSVQEAVVLGPMPCAMPRLRNRYRFEMFVRTRTAKSMTSLLSVLRAKGLLRTMGGRLMVDVDPVTMN